MLRKLAALTALAALSLDASPALAWNARGHMVTAAVAWRQMTPKARARAGELLKLNPYYGAWTAGVPGARKAQVAFVRAATWPDEIKGDPAYHSDRATAEGAAGGQGYADQARHSYWHYKDLPFSPDGTAVQPPEDPNAETQIRAFTTTLSSAEADDDTKSYDLAWLEHLVGDVHQPLHATSRFTADLPKGDRGGNSVKVCRAQPKTTECAGEAAFPLHAFWDDALGVNGTARSAIAKARRMKAAPAGKAAVGDPAAWLEESLTIAQAAVYAEPVGPSAGPFKLSKHYEVLAGSYAERRTALAGARLAQILNAAFQ